MKFQVFINEKKNTVAVKAINPIHEYYKEFTLFYNKFGFHPYVETFEEFVDKYERQIDKMVGIATCNVEAGDVFDAELGEKIARERYLKLFETYRIKMYQMITNKLDKATSESFRRINYCTYRYKERDNKINNIIARHK